MRILPSKSSRRTAQRKRATVEVMESAEKWYGRTYKEDKKSVMDAIAEMKQQGVYPEKLWR